MHDNDFHFHIYIYVYIHKYSRTHIFTYTTPIIYAELQLHAVHIRKPVFFWIYFIGASILYA